MELSKDQDTGSLSTHLETVSSCRVSSNILKNHLVLEKTGPAYKLKENCLRFCLHENHLMLPCPPGKCIEVVSLDGKSVKTIPLDDIDRPRSLHLVNKTHVALAAKSGLYVININSGEYDLVREGPIRDVDVYDGQIVALCEDEEDETVSFYQASPPYNVTRSFSLGHCDGLSILVAESSVFISCGYDRTGVTQHSLTGDVKNKWGSEGYTTPSELDYPILSGYDEKTKQLLVVDCKNHQLKLVSSDGEWSVIEGFQEQYPQDAAVVNGDMFVLYASKADKIVQRYRFCTK